MLADNWDKNQIKYDLFLKGKQSLLEKNFAEDISLFQCQTGTDLGLLQFGYRSLLYDLGGLFKRSDLVTLVTSVNHRFSHMNTVALNDYLSVLKSTNRLNIVRDKLFQIVYDFWGVVCYLMPAIGLLYYKNLDHIDWATRGLSTCSFEDIKSFYQNTYERLLDCCDVIVGLDNLENRGDCNTFKNNLNLDKFRNQRNGNKVQFLDSSEYFTGMFNLPVSSSSLRNAIGHSDYEYNGTKQELRYEEKSGNGVFLTSYLADIALECCRMMRSTYVLAFVIYELSRYALRKSDEPMPMYHTMYDGVKSQSRCPCGSWKKFKQCCRPLIDPNHLEKNEMDYPMKAEFSAPIPGFTDPYWKLRPNHFKGNI